WVGSHVAAPARQVRRLAGRVGLEEGTDLGALYAAAAEAAGAGGVADAWVLRSAGTAEQPSAAGAGEELRRLENELAAVWCTVLGRDRVYRDENFFDLGGNSLLLVAAQTALNKALGCELTVVDLFAHPTVRALARHLADQGTAVPAASAAPAPDPSATQAGTTGAAGTAGTTGTAESEGLGRAKEQAQRQRAARAARRSARERKDRGRG
ncbi:acyl carrier protein, partial [Streptomyces pseudogriseolus]